MYIKQLVSLLIFIVVIGAIDLIVEISHTLSAYQSESNLKDQLNMPRIQEQKDLIPYHNLFFWKT